jgi:hypothetical protein
MTDCLRAQVYMLTIRTLLYISQTTAALEKASLYEPQTAKYNIIMVVTIITGYWHVMSHGLVVKYLCVGANGRLEVTIPLFHPKDASGRFFSKLLSTYQTTHCH